MSDAGKVFTRKDLAYALDEALDNYDLTLNPRCNDEDEPDWADVVAVASRMYRNFDFDEVEEDK